MSSGYYMEERTGRDNIAAENLSCAYIMTRYIWPSTILSFSLSSRNRQPLNEMDGLDDTQTAHSFSFLCTHFSLLFNGRPLLVRPVFFL